MTVTVASPARGVSSAAVAPVELFPDLTMQPKVLLTPEDAPKQYQTWKEIVTVWMTRIHWLHLIILTGVPIIAVVGAFTVTLQAKTAWFSFVYFWITGLGITAGYHRMFAHKAFQGNFITRFVLMLMGSGALQGSIKWWAGGHRIHHRYTDTPKDPYNANGGFWYSHIGWMLIKPDPKHFTKSDIRDLNADPIVRLQHKFYLFVGPFMALVLPTLVCGLGWGDWTGGYIYAGAMRLTAVHHATFCVNSVAHYLGEQHFDDDRTPRDSLITAILTFGEGFHNFHHEFPNDYRNGIEWYHYDPTKWLITILSWVGFAKNLRVFPMNEIKRGKIYMAEKKLEAMRNGVVLPKAAECLPLMSWPSFVTKCASGSKLVVVDGLVHDVEVFLPSHPGGETILKGYIGTDATSVFHGIKQPVLYKHSHAAANLLSNMRIARIDPATLPADKKRE
jgi:stearoyl-CoA desaturase (delta-9 desaturase)